MSGTRCATIKSSQPSAFQVGAGNASAEDQIYDHDNRP